MNRELELAATKLLRKHGFTWAGRTRKAAKAAKQDALQKAIRCPFGGYSRRKRGRC